MRSYLIFRRQCKGSAASELDSPQNLRGVPSLLANDEALSGHWVHTALLASHILASNYLS